MPVLLPAPVRGALLRFLRVYGLGDHAERRHRHPVGRVYLGQGAGDGEGQGPTGGGEREKKTGEVDESGDMHAGLRAEEPLAHRMSVAAQAKTRGHQDPELLPRLRGSQDSPGAPQADEAREDGEAAAGAHLPTAWGEPEVNQRAPGKA